MQFTQAMCSCSIQMNFIKYLQDTQLTRLQARLALAQSTRLYSLNRNSPLKLTGQLCHIRRPIRRELLGSNRKGLMGVGNTKGGSSLGNIGSSRKKAPPQSKKSVKPLLLSLSPPAPPLAESAAMAFFGTLTGVPTGNGTVTFNFKGRK